MGILPRQRAVDDLEFEVAELATYLTYRDSEAVLGSCLGMKVSKSRIFNSVQKVGRFMNEERLKCQGGVDGSGSLLKEDLQQTNLLKEDLLKEDLLKKDLQQTNLEKRSTNKKTQTTKPKNPGI
jgi:hypothetical protein